MAEEEVKKGAEKGESEGKKKKKFKPLELIPLDQIATPKGVVGLILIGMFELIQAVLFPSGLDLIAETAIHILLVVIIAKLFDRNIPKTIKGQLAPFVVGLVPVLSDYFPEIIIMNVILPFFL